MRRIALLTAIILFAITVMVVIWQLRGVAVVFLAAIVIAATLEAPVSWLQQHRWPRGVAIIATYGGVFGGLLLVGALILPFAAREIDPLLKDLLHRYGEIQAQFGALEGPPTRLLNRFPTTEQVAVWLARSQDGTVMQSLFGMAQQVGAVLTQLFLALVVSVYWSASSRRFDRLWLSLLPPERRIPVRSFWRDLKAGVGAYLAGEAAQSVIAGALFVLGYLLMGVKYPFILALLAALAWLIPIFGAALAVILAAGVGALTSPLVAVLAAVYTIAVLAAMEFYVERRMYTHDRYWGVVVVIVMLALGDQLGLWGLILAPPVAVALQIALDAYFAPSAPGMGTGHAHDLAQLRARLTTVRGQVSAETGAAALRDNSLVERLEGLIGEAENLPLR